MIEETRSLKNGQNVLTIFEPATNKKASVKSEALILLGGECRSRTGDLLHAMQAL